MLALSNRFQKQLVASDRRHSEQLADTNAALTIAQQCLNGPGTGVRTMVAQLALSFVIGSATRPFKEEEASRLGSVLRRLAALSSIQLRCLAYFLRVSLRARKLPHLALVEGA